MGKRERVSENLGGKRENAGRKPIMRDRRKLTVYVSKQTAQAIEQRAATEGTSVAAAVRNLLEQATDTDSVQPRD